MCATVLITACCVCAAVGLMVSSVRSLILSPDVRDGIGKLLLHYQVPHDTATHMWGIRTRCVLNLRSTMNLHHTTLRPGAPTRPITQNHRAKFQTCCTVWYWLTTVLSLSLRVKTSSTPCTHLTSISSLTSSTPKCVCLCMRVVCMPLHVCDSIWVHGLCTFVCVYLGHAAMRGGRTVWCVCAQVCAYVCVRACMYAHPLTLRRCLVRVCSRV